MSTKSPNTRFREERLRIGMSHQRVADECGVRKGTVVTWEKETAIPIQKLTLLAGWGFDVLYIGIGERSRYLGKGDIAPEPTNSEEIKLLRLFRNLDRSGKDQAIAVVNAIATSSGINLRKAAKPPG